jgi:hypothetical protein
MLILHRFRDHLVVLPIIVATLSISGGPASADKRVALVIGNGAYVNAAHLPNPPNDAHDVAEALKRSGFEAILGIDLDKAGMDAAAVRFARAARDADVAMFYYSGHVRALCARQYGRVRRRPSAAAAKTVVGTRPGNRASFRSQRCSDRQREPAGGYRQMLSGCRPLFQGAGDIAGSVDLLPQPAEHGRSHAQGVGNLRQRRRSSMYDRGR